MGVPDRTVTQNPQSKTKAPKGAVARTAAVLPLSGVVSFPPSGFPFLTNAPHRVTWGLLFGWYHTQFSAFLFVQNMLEISLTSPLVYGNIHHAKRQKQRKLEEKTMWTEGTIQVGTSTFHYWVKHYEEPSIFGYEEGRASKISLRRNGKTVFNFDRGMDIPPEDEETETALAILLKQYN